MKYTYTTPDGLVSNETGEDFKIKLVANKWNKVIIPVYGAMIYKQTIRKVHFFFKQTENWDYNPVAINDINFLNK